MYLLRSLSQQAFSVTGVAILACLFTCPVTALGVSADAPRQNVDVTAADHGIQSVTVGFNGYFKLGKWTPIHVTYDAAAVGDDAELQVLTLDGDGEPTKYVSSIEELHERSSPSDSSRSETVTIYIKVGRQDARIQVSFTSDQAGRDSYTVPATELHVVPSTDSLFVTIGDSLGFEKSAGSIDPSKPRSVHTVTVSASDSLPNQWYGYDGVNAVAIGSAAAAPEGQTLSAVSESQARAIDLWTRMGGRLLFCGAERVRDIVAQDTVVNEWFPGEFVDYKPIRTLSPVKAYAESSDELELSTGTGSRLRRRTIDMPLFESVDGRIEVFDASGTAAETPMVVRRAYGFGRLIFVSFDLDRAPFDAWAGRSRLIARLLKDEVKTMSSADGGRVSGKVVHVGYEDLAGQLRSAMEQFVGVTPVEFSWIAGLLIVCLLLIGPADYFLVQRLLNRPVLTWVSFPLMIIGFVALVFWMQHQLKSPDVLANHVEVIDVDPQRSVIRGNAWFHLYSPQAAEYRLALSNGLAGADKSFSAEMLGKKLSSQTDVNGLPGSGLGGMDNRAGLQLFNSTSVFSVQPCVGGVGANGEISGVPVATAGSKGFFGQWWPADTSPLEDASAGDLIEQQNHLEGSIRNPLSIALTDCRLLYGRWEIRIDQDFLPGDRINVATLHTGYKDLMWQLTRRVAESGEHASEVSSPWDSSSKDVSRIVEMIMFHEAAGGKKYTKLTNTYHGRLDLSGHLKLGKAVLVGKASTLSRPMDVNGELLPADNVAANTWVRILIPVATDKMN